MTKLTQHLMVFLLCMFAPSCFFACSHKQSINMKEAEAEIWELQVTGETVGKLKLLLKRIKIENDIYSITGRISGTIKDHRAGLGTADYKLEGKIEKDIFKANLSGNSYMAAGLSNTTGSMEGTVFKSHGSGKWSIMHALGFSHGNYIMKKMNLN